MSRRTPWVACGLLWMVVCAAPLAHAQTPATEPSGGNNNVAPDGFVVKPELLSTNNSNGSTLGLDYSYKRKFVFGNMHTAKGPDEETGAPGTISVDALDATVVTGGVIDLLARGTLADTGAITSNKMLDFSATGSYARDARWGYMSLGGRLKFETDQGGSNSQTVYGLSASYTKADVLQNGAYLSLQLGYGTVDPTGDVQRKAVVATLSTFQRGDFELSYNYPLHGAPFKGLEFNYRLYQEAAASAAIKAAGLDQFQLGLVRANLQKDFFVEYSAGSLPFDQQSVRAVKIGWSMKLW